MKILKSFKYALKGIIYTIRNERNMRIHTVACVYVLMLSLFFNLNSEKYIALFLAISLVMVSEMFNSSVEGLVDVYSKNYNSLAKAAKDIAAGAVLIAAGFAVLIGIFLFHDIACYKKIIAFFASCPILGIAFIIFTVCSYFYVFWGPAEIKNRLKNLFSTIKSNNK